MGSDAEGLSHDATLNVISTVELALDLSLRLFRPRKRATWFPVSVFACSNITITGEEICLGASGSTRPERASLGGQNFHLYLNASLVVQNEIGPRAVPWANKPPIDIAPPSLLLFHVCHQFRHQS